MCILFFILFTEINRVLDTVAQKMQLDFTQKLDSTDANMKETFNKQLKGKVRFIFLFLKYLDQILFLPIRILIYYQMY